jgi:hypothetical protein
VYFEQGINAAITATCWDDADRLNPHTIGTAPHRVWKHGFVWKFMTPIRSSSNVVSLAAFRAQQKG